MKINNYGELLAHGLNLKLLAYKEYGSYQGDYIAILGDNDNVYLYRGSYGSCSGCDWLEAEKHWENDEVSEEKIKEFVKDEKPFLVISEDNIEAIRNAKDISVFFPANTRNGYGDWTWDDIKQLILEALDKK